VIDFFFNVWGSMDPVTNVDVHAGLGCGRGLP